jgi:hypothetical protein
MVAPSISIYFVLESKPHVSIVVVVNWFDAYRTMRHVLPTTKKNKRRYDRQLIFRNREFDVDYIRTTVANHQQLEQLVERWGFVRHRSNLTNNPDSFNTSEMDHTRLMTDDDNSRSCSAREPLRRHVAVATRWTFPVSTRYFFFLFDNFTALSKLHVEAVT